MNRQIRQSFVLYGSCYYERTFLIMNCMINKFHVTSTGYCIKALKDVWDAMKVSFALSLPITSLVLVCHCIGAGVKLFVKPRWRVR